MCRGSLPSGPAEVSVRAPSWFHQLTELSQACVSSLPLWAGSLQDRDTVGLVQDDVDANWFLRLWLLGGFVSSSSGGKLGFKAFCLVLDVDITAEERACIWYRLGC